MTAGSSQWGSSQWTLSVRSMVAPPPHARAGLVAWRRLGLPSPSLAPPPATPPATPPAVPPPTAMPVVVVVVVVVGVVVVAVAFAVVVVVVLLLPGVDVAVAHPLQRGWPA